LGQEDHSGYVCYATERSYHEADCKDDREELNNGSLSLEQIQRQEAGMKILIMIAVFTFLLMLVCIKLQDQENKKYNSWVDKCVKRGGVAFESGHYMTGTRYHCSK
jgi:hypothetical protein